MHLEEQNLFMKICKNQVSELSEKITISDANNEQMTTKVNTLSTNLAITKNLKEVNLKIKQDLIDKLLKEIKDKYIFNNILSKFFLVI